MAKTKEKPRLRPLHRITDKMTYDTIVDLTHKGRGRPPSISDLARALGTVKSNAYAHVKKLTRAGLIEKPKGNLNVVVAGSKWSPPDYPKVFDSVGLLPRKTNGGNGKD
jgi:DNA-binding transcriptional ArsR family regulator